MIKRLIFLLVILITFSSIEGRAQSNTSYRFRKGTNLPSSCASGDVFYRNSNNTFYGCASGSWSTFGGGGGSGTVTSVSVTTANGVSGSVATATTTPAITLILGAITPSSISTSGSISAGVGGSVAGTLELTQGTAPTAGTTSVKIYAPASVTSYALALPGAAATGLGHYANAAGVVTMSISAVVEADITLAANTTNNVSTTKHGFAPVLPNDATKYLDGTGAYSIPAGGGGGANTSLSNLASVAINTDLLPASTQGLGNASFPFLTSFTGNTTQYESVVQTAGLITHAALGSATNIGFAFTPKGTGGVSFPVGTLANVSMSRAGTLGTGIYFPFTSVVSIVGIGAPIVDFVNNGAGSSRIDFYDSGGTVKTRYNDSGFHNGPLVAFTWAPTTVTVSEDTNISRISAGLIGIGTGAASSFAGSLKLTDITPTGAIIHTGITADTAHTDSAVCQDTTTHQYYSGTGTLGVCLGTSTLKAKNNIREMSVGLDELMRLRPISFTYREGWGYPIDKIYYGFGAEDVLPILPNLTPLNSKGQPNSIDLLGMVPLTIHAIQQQQAEIEILKSRITKLEGHK